MASNLRYKIILHVRTLKIWTILSISRIKSILNFNRLYKYHVKPTGNDFPQKLNDNELEKVACTIVAKNYLPMALVLRDSFKATNPEWDFKILLCDLFDSQTDIRDILSHCKNELIPISSLLDQLDFDLFDMAIKYNVIELNTAIKPFFLNSLFQKGYKKVVYFDPDILVLDKLDELDHLLDTNSIVLTPHITDPIPEDNKKPNDLDILKAGSFNLGFLGLKRSNDSQQFLLWWQERLSKYCFMQVNEGMHVDQNWVNFVPCFFDSVHVIRNKSYNVAYWNLHERQVSLDENTFYVGNDKLKFFHFSGFQIDDLGSISKHQSRHTLDNYPDLEELFKRYKNLLLRYQVYEFQDKKYSFNKLIPVNIKIPSHLRALYLSLPSSKKRSNYYSQCISLIDYANEKLFVKPDITRLEYEIYKSRNDVKMAFPDIENNLISREHFCHWIQSSGSKEYSMNKVFSNGNDNIRHITERPFGINFFGYFNNIFGVAEIARAVFTPLLYTGTPFLLCPVNTNYHYKLPEGFRDFNHMQKFFSAANPYSINLLMINADQIPNIWKHFGKENFSDTYNIACWFWEIEDFFPFPDAINLVDEIWGFSDFCCNIYKKFASKPVIKITYPFHQSWKTLIPSPEVRRIFDVPDSSVVFIFTFDFHSCFERKNPIGLIKAFLNAFPVGDEDVILIIKSIHAEKFLNEALELHEACKVDNRIRWINQSMTKEEIISLINACDCFVSLHRSEGFGIGLAEAMFLGKSTIATAYGGNIDFMNDENSLLVPYTMIPIEKEFGPYKRGYFWAEPDYNEASKIMKLLSRDKDLRMKIGTKASDDIKTQLNPNKTADEILRRISEINLKK